MELVFGSTFLVQFVCIFIVCMVTGVLILEMPSSKSVFSFHVLKVQAYKTY